MILIPKATTKTSTKPAAAARNDKKSLPTRGARITLIRCPSIFVFLSCRLMCAPATSVGNSSLRLIYLWGAKSHGPYFKDKNVDVTTHILMQSMYSLTPISIA